VAPNQQANIHFYGKRNENHDLIIDYLIHKIIISAVKRVEFISYRMSYIILRSRWWDIIVVNVHAPTEDKTDDVKNSFYEELQCVFDNFPKYHMNILFLSSMPSLQTLLLAAASPTPVFCTLAL
jgi:hypothetical protein